MVFAQKGHILRPKKKRMLGKNFFEMFVFDEVSCEVSDLENFYSFEL